MDAWTQIVLAVLALGGPFLAYLLAIRKTAGRIRTSDASELWEEARTIRHECADRVRLLEARVQELEGINMDLLTENYRLLRIASGDGHA